MLAAEPSFLQFQEVPIGRSSDGIEVTVRNTSETPLSLRLATPDYGVAVDFKVHLGNSGLAELAPRTETKFSVYFFPLKCGRRVSRLEIIAAPVGIPTEETRIPLDLEGIGVPADRFSIHEVALAPKDDRELRGSHYVIAVSNPAYLRNLQANGLSVNWYSVVHTTTHESNVGLRYELRPGEVPLKARDSCTDKDSVIECYNLQCVSTRWLDREHASLTNADVQKTVEEKLKAAFNWARPKDLDGIGYAHLESRMPVQGALLEFDGLLYVTLFPPLLSAYFSTKLHEPHTMVTLALRALRAMPDEATTMISVRTGPKGSFGPLFIPCFNPRPLRFAPDNITRLDCSLELRDILDRVFCYLGLE